MGYVGAESIEELQAKADFHRLSMAGIAESHPHDMVLTENLPNYWRDA
ncbi:MAG: IMP dehydrogenase [Patescibacteria group bacterium]